jgi:Fanconi anemia group M protein
MESKFFNIFQTPKQRVNSQEPLIKILIDYREKNSLVASELKKLGFEIEFQELKVGDYITNNIIIERKTTQDFISSMLSGRMIKQLQNMNCAEKKLLIIEGYKENELYEDNNKSGLNPNSIRGFILSITLKYNVPIIFTKDALDTAKYLSVLAKKPKTSNERSLNISKKCMTKQERKRFILEGFPGVGPNTSKNLLKKFGSIKNVINADKESLKKTLGDKKTDKFKQILEEQY